jgi:hypothetical protein
MKQTLLLFLAIGLFTTGIYSQDKAKQRQIFSDAMFFYEREDYSEALYNFLRLYELDSTNASINYKIGCCYLEISGEEHKSIFYLKKASKNITDDYNEYSFNQQKAPLHTLFYLARAYRIDNQINKSINTLKEFQNSPYFYGMYNDDIVEREMTICKRARILQDNPVKYEKVKLKKPINDSASEMYPVVSGDVKSMVFIRKLKFYDALLHSIKVDGKWQEPKNITPLIGSDGRTYPVSMSNNGKILFLVRKTEDGHDDLFVSYYENDKWTNAVNLGEKINSGNNETHACISSSGKQLFFTSDRPLGKGNLDIYMCTREEDGSWSRPNNLGTVINSRFNETTPFITDEGNTLFFSSEDHYNMGMYDIFYSRKGKDGKWGEPQNIGFPINTTKSNTFFVPVNGGKYGFIHYKENGDYDIFRLKLLFSPFEEIDDLLEQNKEISLDIIDKNDNKSLEILIDPDTRKIKSDIPKGYEIKVK